MRTRHAHKHKIGWLLPALLLAPALTPLPLPLAATPAHAQDDEDQAAAEISRAERLARHAEAAPTSRLAGFKLPANASRLTDKKTVGEFGKVLRLLAKEFEMTPQGEDVEVLAWAGPAYKPGWSGFARAAIQSAVEKSGHEVKSFDDDSMKTNPFEFFDAGGEDAGFDFTMWPTDSLRGFTARNERSGEALVGTWIENEDDRLLLLALSRARFQPKAKRAPLPAVPASEDVAAAPASDGVLLKNPNDVMGGSRPKLPQFAKLAAKPGHLRGVVRNAAGKPLQGAKVLVSSTAIGGLKSYVSGITNASGAYEIPLPAGSCQVTGATYFTTYHGVRLALPLHPVGVPSGFFASSKGAVANFALLPYGVADPDDAGRYTSYYGGGLRLTYDELPEGATIEITLAPQGALVDGSQGRTLVVRRATSEGTNAFSVNNIPVGRYKISARLLADGQALPLRMAEHQLFAHPDISTPGGLSPKQATGSATLLFRFNQPRTLDEVAISLSPGA